MTWNKTILLYVFYREIWAVVFQWYWTDLRAYGLPLMNGRNREVLKVQVWRVGQKKIDQLQVGLI